MRQLNIDRIKVVTFKHRKRIEVHLMGEGQLLKILEKEPFSPGDDLTINFGADHGKGQEDSQPEKD